MKTGAYRPMLIHELADEMGIDKSQKKMLQDILNEMEKEGLVMRTKHKRYGIPEKMGFMIGVLHGHRNGFGFVDSDDPEVPSAFIPANSMKGAIHRDRVLVKIRESASEDQKQEGEIVSVIERRTTELAGTFEKSKNYGFVIPDDQRINTDIFIPAEKSINVPNGHKVICEITSWSETRRNPEGKIIEILGDPQDPETDIKSIISKFGLTETFDKGVLKEANRIEQTVPENEISKRRDLRKQTIFTIDGPDAKDLDDAVSVESLPDHVIRLGVHIADVAHYVKANSKLDVEAHERGTSVYLVDRVIPMLPQELSNGICSLNPKVDRLTMSVFMDINEQGNVIHHEIMESVINSKERMVYDDISDILERNDQRLSERYHDMIDDLNLMHELSKRLRKKRDQRGAIDFHFAESKIILDDEGNTVDIQLEERRTANRMIEEFMLVCNETVAEHHFWLKQPFIYRIHEDPDEEKIIELSHFVHHFGYTLKGIQNDVHPKILQQLLHEAEGKKEAPVISTMMLRSLKKARYTATHDTHFGLAARYYSHFTSPIRRYPDLAIHRIIKNVLCDGVVTEPDRLDSLKKSLEKTAAHASEQERNAEEAERETVDLKKTMYMAGRIGEVYDGLISGITSFGLFVELGNTVEGLIRLSALDDDYYVYDKQHLTLTGERTRKIFRIGEPVRIQVEGVNLSQREIDFVLIESLEEEKPPSQ